MKRTRQYPNRVARASRLFRAERRRQVGWSLRVTAHRIATARVGEMLVGDREIGDHKTDLRADVAAELRRLDGVIASLVK